MKTKSPLRDVPDVLLNYALSVSQEFRLHLYDGGLYAVALDGTMMLSVTASPDLYGPPDDDAYEDLDFEIAENGIKALAGIDGDWCWNGDELTAAPGLEVLVMLPANACAN